MADNDNQTPDDATRITDETLKHSRVLKDRFVLLAEIGRGGMGIVWKALDKRREEAKDPTPYVAIKLINTRLKEIENSDIALQREAKKSQNLAHPNIATVYDFDRDGDDAFICMELLDGAPLSSLIEKNPSGLTPDEAFHIIFEMAKGLAFAHSKGLVHSDFKPGNVFVTSDNSVKILDFGIARAIAKDHEQTHATVFDPSQWNAITPAYASPEMFREESPDPRDDIFALGCVSYQLLCGKHPYDKTPSLQLVGSKRSLPKIKSISREANRTLQQAVSLQRNQRIQNAEEFLNGFPRWNRKSSKKPAVIAIALLTAIACIFVVLYVGEKKDNRTNQIIVHERWQSVTTPIPEEQTERIKALFKAARAHEKIGRYIKPKSVNAAEAYMAILKLNPGNAEAIAAADSIANRIIDEAEMLKNKGMIDEAKEGIEQALEILKDHPGLLEAIEQYQQK